MIVMPKYMPLENGRTVELLEDYPYVSESDYTIIVPTGFKSDLASVPRILWPIFPPFGRYTPAAVIHDYLYDTGITTKQEADKMFLEISKKCGVELINRYLMYYAVVLFGFPNYAYTDIIKKYEGLSLTKYVCPGGVSTIGYGHSNVENLEKITENDADILLGKDIFRVHQQLKKYVKVRLNRNQIDALTSFVFNIGETQFSKSTLLKKLNAGDTKGAAEEFLRWNKAGGNVLKGLIKRRTEERNLFLK
jgi:lysozyme